MNPLVSVVMPTYNSAEYVAEAIESILAQSMPDFELLIINEYLNNDGTAEIADGFHDPRIRVIQNTKKLGIAESLNEGIRQAKGKYIARMDADDISEPDRLEKQAVFMEENPKISVLGGWFEMFGQINHLHRSFADHEYIKAAMLFDNELCHPSIFIRKCEITENGLFYDPEYITEDYELWLRAIEVARFACLPEILGRRRVHTESAVRRKNLASSRQDQSLYARSLAKLDIDYPKDYTLCSWLRFSAEHSKSEWRERLIRLEKLLRLIIKQNQSYSVYDQTALALCANRYWLSQMDFHDECSEGDNKLPLELIIDRILQQADAKAGDKSVTLYGLGRIGSTALPYFQEYFRKRLICVSDGDPQKWSRKYLGLECVAPKAIPKDTTVFVATGYDLMATIIPSLTELSLDCVYPYTGIKL